MQKDLQDQADDHDGDALFTDTYLPQTNGVVAYLCDIIGALSKEHEVVLFAPGETGIFP